MVTVMHQWYQWKKPPLARQPGLVLEDILKPSRSKRLLLRKAKCIQGKITSLSEIQNLFGTFSGSKSFRDHIWWHLLQTLNKLGITVYNFITVRHPPRTTALPWWTCLGKYDATNIFSKRNLSRVQIPKHRSTRWKSTRNHEEIHFESWIFVLQIKAAIGSRHLHQDCLLVYGRTHLHRSSK